MKIFIMTWIYFLVVIAPLNAQTYETLKAELMEQFKSFTMTEEQIQVINDGAEEIRQSLMNPGLKVGDRAPLFTLMNDKGEKIVLGDYLRKGPVVLVFYRGSWCAFCNIHLKSIDQMAAVVREKGATIFAVSPQKPDEHAVNPFQFDVLFDTDYEVIRQYQLYFEMPKPLLALYKNDFNIDLEMHNGQGRTGLPVPATFIIDQAGVIQAAYADTDYKNRMEPSAIVAALDALTSKL